MKYVASVSLLLFVPQFTFSDETPLLEEVIITGSRAAPRSVFDSPAPIDVIGADQIAKQGDTDITNLLRNVVPSYNVNTQPISDAATIVRPANLRGLAPDHTLVLINGKRRHRAAVIYWLGNGVSDGAQGPDISPIPAISLKQVEVLRDGAAAQYGSDAIAGVMNFILNDSPDGNRVELKAGQYYEGDGSQVTLAGTMGTSLLDDGFMRFSFEYGNTEATDRSVQREDARKLIKAGNTEVNDPAQVWGQPEVKDDLKTFLNAGIPLSENIELYAFGNYAQKEVEGGFYFRNPDTRSAVFATVADNPEYDEVNNPDVPEKITVRLVGDLTPDSSGNCPKELKPSDAEGLQAVIDDPNCFVFNEMFPGGFTPRFGGEAKDSALALGIKSDAGEGWNWDASYSFGKNDVDFFIKNTVNASLGPDTPTEFNPGAYTQTDQSLNVDLSNGYDVGFASDLTVALGAEWREETFEITVGDAASYEIGPLATQGFSSASNGFPGFSPIAGGKWGRENTAIYVDLSANVTDPWLVETAIRWEDFEDFGQTTNGKITTSYHFTDSFALRASASTGFRAPTPGQSNAFNVSTEFDQDLGDLVNNGTIPSTNPVALLKGGKPLDPEKSTNYSFGTVIQTNNFNITVDFFQIILKDRLAVSQLFTLKQEEIDDLVASGITNAANLQQFRFFTNDFDTTTSGVDIVASWSAEMFGGETDFNIAYNYTKTKVDKYSPKKIDQTRIDELEKGLPDTRLNWSALHSTGDWSYLFRLNYFDKFYDSEDDHTYGSLVTFDTEVSYLITDAISLVVGAQNLFDEYPEEATQAAQDGKGNKYSQFSPSGFGGGFYYTTVKFEF